MEHCLCLLSDALKDVSFILKSASEINAVLLTLVGKVGDCQNLAQFSKKVSIVTCTPVCFLELERYRGETMRLALGDNYIST